MSHPGLRDRRAAFDVARECEALLEVRDDSIGLLGWIAIHDSSVGPGGGGIRRLAYASDEHAVIDAVGLATQMTLKARFAGLPCGGAKAVLLDRRAGADVDWPAIYRAFGRAVASLDGRYLCGPDVGTGAAELAWVREAAAPFTNSVQNDASEATARAVLAGIRACVETLPEEPRDLRVLVQGVGRVGSRVVDGLPSPVREVLISDTCAQAVAAVQERAPGARSVPPAEAATTPCDLWSPCAVGPVVTRENVGRLGARVLCGSANRQLATDSLADALHERGILYAPDFVVSAGAVIEGVLVMLEPGEDVRERVAARIDGTRDRLASVFAEAARRDLSPLRVASERVG